MLFNSALALAAITTAAVLVQAPLGLSPFFPLKVMLVFGSAAILLAVLAGKYLASPTFGLANRITLARAALTALLIGLIGENSGAGVAWFAATAALIVLVLDGVDGWVARSRGDASNFGARFDMETDALLIFGIAMLAWQYDKAGPWILAAGLMRYAFVASGFLLPWMNRPLPYSTRRKKAFVAQALSLIACIAPPLAQPFSAGVALGGLLLLSASFAIDAAWLGRRRFQH